MACASISQFMILSPRGDTIISKVGRCRPWSSGHAAMASDPRSGRGGLWPVWRGARRTLLPIF